MNVSSETVLAEACARSWVPGLGGQLCRDSRIRTRGRCIQTFLFLACFAMSPAWRLEAQASLAAEDKIDEIQVTIDGVVESFTVVRDALVEEQWYYMPDRPRLFERTVDGVTEPEFALIRYQFKDPDNPQDLLEGGLLQFAASLAIPPEALPQLEKVIRQKTASDKPIRLAAMPFKDATVNLYTPGEGQLIAEAPKGSGIAPTFATQKMAFSVPMTRVGSDVYDELVNGNTGMPVVVEFSFNGLTPPAGFKVEVDWDQTYDFYSKHQSFAAAASWKGLVGGAVSVDHQKIRSTLEDNKCIKVLVTEGESLSQAQIDKHLEPILNRINQELVEHTKPPEKIEPSKAPKAKATGRFFSASYSVAIKDVELVKKGKEVIDFNVRQHQTRKTIAAGFIGIGRYPDELKERLVTVVPEGEWRSAFFVLPAVGDGEELGITQVDLEIGLSDGNEVRQSQVVVWTPQDGWKDRNGKPRTVLTFALMGLAASGFDLDQATFESRAQITHKRRVLAIDQTFDVFDGEKAVTTPLAAVDVATIDGSILSWRKVDGVSDLAAVSVKLQSGSQSFSGSLKPRNVDGTWVEPVPLHWLVEKDAGPITARVRFLLNSGKGVEWQHNGKDLEEDLASLEVFLVDGDWQQE